MADAHPNQPIIDIVLPTYRMEPDEGERFYPSVAKAIADKIMNEELNGQEYSEKDARIWNLNISDKVREALQEKLSTTRYKIVVQTTIGQMRDQGIKIASRCLWDPTTDNYVSSTFTNRADILLVYRLISICPWCNFSQDCACKNQHIRSSNK